MPDRPSMSRFQTNSAPTPSGVTRPIPVMTTRFMPARCVVRRDGPLPQPAGPAASSLMCFDEIDRILDGHDLFGCVVRDLAAEFLLESHDQLDRVEAVGSEIVDEAGIVDHLRFVDAKMLHDDLFYSFGDIAHWFVPRRINALWDWDSSVPPGKPAGGFQA